MALTGQNYAYKIGQNRAKYDRFRSNLIYLYIDLSTFVEKMDQNFRDFYKLLVNDLFGPHAHRFRYKKSTHRVVCGSFADHPGSYTWIHSRSLDHIYPFGPYRNDSFSSIVSLSTLAKINPSDVISFSASDLNRID